MKDFQKKYGSSLKSEDLNSLNEDYLKILHNDTTKGKKKMAKTKTKKTKTKTKRARSAYILYSIDARKAIREENPEMSMTEVTKQIGARWKKLSNKQKEPYVKQNLAEKAEIEKAKLESNPKPKRPRTAFILFGSSVRDKIRKANPDMAMTDVTKEISNQWKSLSEAKKKPFQAAYEKEKEEYAVKFAAWEQVEKQKASTETVEESTPVVKKASKKVSKKSSKFQKTSRNLQEIFCSVEESSTPSSVVETEVQESKPKSKKTKSKRKTKAKAKAKTKAKASKKVETVEDLKLN